MGLTTIKTILIGAYESFFKCAKGYPRFATGASTAPSLSNMG
jgi:hypothetical protein